MSDASQDAYLDALSLVRRTANPSPTFIARELGMKFADAERLLKRMAKDGHIEGPFADRPPFRMRDLPK